MTRSAVPSTATAIRRRRLATCCSARHLKIDPEAAAEKTCNKFVSRFAEMERQATAAGKKLADLSLSELDALWDSAKHEEHA